MKTVTKIQTKKRNQVHHALPKNGIATAERKYAERFGISYSSGNRTSVRGAID